MVGGCSTNRPCDQNVANGKGKPKGVYKEQATERRGLA